MSQVTSSFLNEEIRWSHWIPLILILLLMRVEGEVKSDILKIETNQEKNQNRKKISLVTIVARIDIRWGNIASSSESRKKHYEEKIESKDNTAVVIDSEILLSSYVNKSVIILSAKTHNGQLTLAPLIMRLLRRTYSLNLKKVIMVMLRCEISILLKFLE